MQSEKTGEAELRSKNRELSRLKQKLERADNNRFFSNEFYSFKGAAYKYYGVSLIEIRRLEEDIAKLQKEVEASKGFMNRVSKSATKFFDVYLGASVDPQQKAHEDRIINSRVKRREQTNTIRNKYGLNR